MLCNIDRVAVKVNCPTGARKLGTAGAATSYLAARPTAASLYETLCSVAEEGCNRPCSVWHVVVTGQTVFIHQMQC